MADPKDISLLRDPKKDYCYAFTKRGYLLALSWLVLTLAACCYGCWRVFCTVPAMADGDYASGPQIFLHVAPFAMLGASLAYLRKLYLIGFRHSKREDLHTDLDVMWRRRATLIYFFTRPFFVGVSVYFLFAALLYGLSGILFGSVVVGREGLLMVEAASFFMGVSGGKSMDIMRGIGTKVLQDMFASSANEGDG